jgi:GTP cyclohydrolase I
MCSHHLLPFTGTCDIGYIPNDKICGASKLIRAVEKFAHKPQLQEKLCTEITEFLMKQLKPLGVIVVIESQHECMTIRGVRNRTAKMVTSEVRGIFKEDRGTRQEFMELIK